MSVRIFVEGNDDKKFIVSLLNHLKLHQKIMIESSVNFNNYIEVMGSKSNLLDATHKKYDRLAQKIGYEIQTVLFIFDCDFELDDAKCNGMEKSEKCFDKFLEQLNWNIQIDKTEHLHIFNRNLDYFLIETINDKECYSQFDNLVKCLELENIKPNKKPIANLYKDLYPHPKFAFEDDRFTPLKTKLTKLFN